jgi:hypothetical protein
MDWTCSVLWLPGFLWSSYIICWKLRGKVHHLIAGFPPSHFLPTWLVSKVDLHLLSWWPLSTSGGKAAATCSMSARLGFRMWEILIFKWFLLLKIQINSKKPCFGRKNQLRTWTNGTGHTSISALKKFRSSIRVFFCSILWGRWTGKSLTRGMSQIWLVIRHESRFFKKNPPLFWWHVIEL